MLLPLTLLLHGLPLAQAYRPHDYPPDAQQPLAVPREPIRKVAVIGKAIPVWLYQVHHISKC